MLAVTNTASIGGGTALRAAYGKPSAESEGPGPHRVKKRRGSPPRKQNGHRGVVIFILYLKVPGALPLQVSTPLRLGNGVVHFAQEISQIRLK